MTITEKELTIKVLNKLTWDYYKELNPTRRAKSLPIYAGDLIQGILLHNTMEKTSKYLGFSYKAIYTSTERFLRPILGQLNGGAETWNFRLMHFIEYKK